MGKPTVRVRVAFADGPYVASPTWTDITTYVRGINTSRGRNDDWQNFDSGSASLVLDNRTRRFDPTYTAGPYYGNLQPRRQIYIDATTDGGSTYKAIFRGYIDGWPVFLTQSGYDSTVTINCYDLLGLISQNTAPYDWTDYYIKSLGPSRYYKCDDVINPTALATTTIRDYGSDAVNLSPKSTSMVTANDAPLAVGIPYQSVNIAVDGYWTSATAISTATTVVSSSYWFIIPKGDTVLNQAFWSWYDTGGTFWYAVSAYVYDTSGYYGPTGNYIVLTIFKGTSATPPVWDIYAPLTLDMSAGHQITTTIDVIIGSPTTFTYVDGQIISMSVKTRTGVGAASPLTRIQNRMQQFCIFPRALTPTEINTLYQYCQGTAIESTAARFTKAMQQTSVDASLYSTAANPVNTVAKINNGGEPIRTTIQLAGDSEAGEIYTSKAGVLTFVNQNWYTGTTAANSQATFGASGIPIGTDMNYSWTANGIRNALNMTWSGDTTINVKDDTSITAYGAQQDNYDTQISTATQTESTGTVLVGFGKLPRLVMSAVQLNQALSLAQWATVLDLELLQRITVAVPERVGSNVTQQQIIQQIEHQITPGDWQTTILGSSRWSSVFVLNSSVLDGGDLLG